MNLTSRTRLSRKRVRDVFERVREDGFLRNVTILIGGTIGARAILVLSLPLLTRIFTPEDFEMLAFFMATLSLVTVIANLRLNMAITLPAEDTEAANLLALALISAVIFSAVLALPVLFVPEATTQFLGQPGFLTFLWMLPIGVLLAAGYQALQYWASRKHRFGLVARTRVARAAGGSGTQLILGVGGFAPFGLLFGYLVYSGLGIIGLARNILLNDRKAFAAISIRGMKRSFVAYRRFPTYSVPEALANAAGVHVPVILIAAAAAGPEAGYLALAMQVMAVPMALVGQSVAQVYIAEAPEKLRAGTLSAFTTETSLTLLKLGSAVLIPIGLLAPLIFSPLFGTEWGRAGEIVLWMTPWHILQFTASPISSVLHVTGHLRTAMLLQFLGAVIRVGGVAIAAAVATGWLSEVYAISGAVFYMIYIAVILRVTREG